MWQIGCGQLTWPRTFHEATPNPAAALAVLATAGIVDEVADMVVIFRVHTQPRVHAQHTKAVANRDAVHLVNAVRMIRRPKDEKNRLPVQKEGMGAVIDVLPAEVPEV